MGRRESPDIEEIKFICDCILKGRTDGQIKGDLEEDQGGRDVRTIRKIRRIFLAGHEVTMGYLKRAGIITKDQPNIDFNQFVEMVSKMDQGLHPYYDEKTGKIIYGLEF